MVSGSPTFIEEMADNLFGKQDSEFIGALHGIAWELAGKPSKEDWIKMMKARLYGNPDYPHIVVNPVYGDVLVGFN